VAQTDGRLTYRRAVADLQAGRLRYAEAFLRFKIGHVTDGQAHQQAIIETGDAVTILEAEVDLAAIDAGVHRCR